MTVWFYDKKKNRIDVDEVEIKMKSITIKYNDNFGVFPCVKWDGEYIICTDFKENFRLEVNKRFFNCVLVKKGGKIIKKIGGDKCE